MILHNTTEQYVTQYIPHNGKDPPSPQWQCATSPPFPRMAMSHPPCNGNGLVKYAK